jgi:hypothetical protein
VITKDAVSHRRNPRGKSQAADVIAAERPFSVLYGRQYAPVLVMVAIIGEAW